jgi:hypothetical protein
MDLSWSWPQSLVRRFRQLPGKKQCRRRPAPAYRNFRFESLEDRSVLSATFGSALNVGGPAGDGIFHMAVDSAGNSYVTGSFSGTVDFDLSAVHAGDADVLTARGHDDAFVAKYAPDNSLVWVRQMGGDEPNPSGSVTDVGRQIAVDSSGNVYVVGEFKGAADFGATTLVSNGFRDGFVTKLDAAGNFAWTQRTSLSDGGLRISRGVGVDAQGNVYAMTLHDTDRYDVLKFTASGGSAWTKSFVTNNAYPGNMAVSAAGKVVVVGQFSGSVDFDPGPKLKNLWSGNVSAFVVQLDSAGKFEWVTTFTGGSSAAETVTFDGSGNVIVAGYYRGVVDFNPAKATTTLPSVGGGYIAKLNSSGGLVWARALESSSSVLIQDLAVDLAGNVYATGSFYGTVDLDPSSGVDSKTTAGGGDIFFVKLTSSGSFAWAESFGGSGTDVGWGIAVDS